MGTTCRLSLRQRRIGLGKPTKTSAALGHKYEPGKNRISASHLYELGKALGVPVTFFFERLTETAAEAPKPSAARTANRDDRPNTPIRR